MRLAVTGFVSSAGGSIAGAGAILVRQLLDKGCTVDFFSKSAFVDPRPAVGGRAGFRFIDVCNAGPDALRQRLSGVPAAGFLASRFDAFTYNRLLVSRMDQAHRERPYDLCLWLGDYARGRVPGLPNCSFAQGAPGTDARSIFRHAALLRRLAGPWRFLRLAALARLRLSPAGLPPFRFSDHVIVGSSQSRNTLSRVFGVHRSSSMPYPIDLELFRPSGRASGSRAFRCLWLGRIVPRKRLDLLLGAAERLIASGFDLEVTIAGSPSLVPELSRLIEEFPHPDRLVWRKSVPRDEVPALMDGMDVLVQPSEEEDFGSSVAEAQACGLPVIVGGTNGNRDYIGQADLVLPEDSPSALADAIRAVAARRPAPHIRDPMVEATFSPARVGDRFLEILAGAASAGLDERAVFHQVRSP